MKKNITINLCGRLFQIDEDAYELLQQYIESLRASFGKQEGGEEIADDIEERIAELFDDLKAQGIAAITIEHVQNVISQIGQVEEIAGEETSSETSHATGAQAAAAQQAKKSTEGKKFYRDSQNKVFAGVCAGCAHYFGGSAVGWRWGYVIACIGWWLICGFNPFTITVGPAIIALLPFALLLTPILFFPFLPYLLTAILAPETKTPEDMLKMKGKEVNPQNLAAVVQSGTTLKQKKEGESTFWNILVGIFSVGLSTFLTIGFIVALCFFVAFLAAQDMMADKWWNVDQLEDLQAITTPVIFSGVLLLASIGILLYCAVHAAASSFGKTPSMSGKHRLMWFLLWVASLAGFIGCTVWAVGRLAKTQTERWDKEKTEWNKTHTHYGFVFNDDDWRFFEENGWKLVTAENTDRYTYNGEYMTGDLTRYLDACSWGSPINYQAEKEITVEPGIYRLSAAVRADHYGCYIFCDEQKKEIPNYGNDHGNIWELLNGVSIKENHAYMDDPILQELVNRISEDDKQKIMEANGSKGYGWSYVYIDSIKVEQTSTLTYGVKVDDSQNADDGWFSATDFTLDRLGDL